MQSSVIGVSKARKVSRRRVRTRIVLWSFGGFVTKLFIEFSIEPSLKPSIKCFIVRSLKPLFRSELVFRKRLFFGIQYLACGI